MRAMMLGMAAIAAVGAATVGTAKAQDYPYCLSGRNEGSPGDCSYSTYAQCEASASGREGVCGLNPRVAFARHPALRGWSYGRGYQDNGIW